MTTPSKPITLLKMDYDPEAPVAETTHYFDWTTGSLVEPPEETGPHWGKPCPPGCAIGHNLFKAKK